MTGRNHDRFCARSMIQAISESSRRLHGSGHQHGSHHQEGAISLTWGDSLSRELKALRSWLGKDLGPQSTVFVAVAEEELPIHLTIVCPAIVHGCAQLIRFFDAEMTEWPRIRLPVTRPNPRLIVADNPEAFLSNIVPRC